MYYNVVVKKKKWKFVKPRFILSFELDEDTSLMVAAKARELDRPKSWVIRKALMEWLRQNSVSSTVEPIVSEGVVKGRTKAVQPKS